MDLVRINNEYFSAKQQFPNLELHQNNLGTPYIKTILKTSNDQLYIVTVNFPYNYPNEMPEVFVLAPKIISYSPHLYKKGNLCYMHPSMWNPGKHNLIIVVARISKWLNKYEVWKKTDRWPGASIKH